MTTKIINLTTVPDYCYAYTEVFQTVRMEHALLALVFLVLGILIGMYGD